MTRINQQEINAKISLTLTKKEKICSVCGSDARRQVGGSGKRCKDHKRLYKSVTFEDCKTDKTRKQFLIRKHGHECQECHLKEWRGFPIPIQLDHIDGNPGNSKEENLRLLCPNCHALTPTYCGKNVGKFSSQRSLERENTRWKYSRNAAVV